MIAAADYRVERDRLMTERDYQDLIISAAKTFGWTCYHTYLSRRSEPGFPDLCLVKPPTLIFLEVKTEHGRVGPRQAHWIAILGAVPGVIARIVRPSQFSEIELLLRGEA